jgi:hypothetical protein
MGCCNNNKKNCQNPKEEMTDMTSWIVKGLADIVKTGKLSALFKNPAADELAIMIVNVLDENKYLRALLGVMKPGVAITDETFKISFGPNGGYTLAIPVTNEGTRRDLIADLKKALAQLEGRDQSADNKQMALFDSLK